MKHSTLYFTLFMMALLATSCATSQDEGSGGNPSAFNLRAVDGYLSYSLVFNDSNLDNVLDAWEPWAFTDKNGYVSYNPITGYDYCADSTPLSKKVHCLEIPSGDSQVFLRVTDGLDSTTIQKFKGTMTLSLPVSAGADQASIPVASPLTSIISGLSATEIDKVVSNEGLSAASVLSANPLVFVDNTVNSSADEFAMLKLGLLTHKVADVIADGLAKRFDLKASAALVPTYKDISHMVYDELVKGYIASGQTANMSTYMTTGSGINTAIANVVSDLVAKGETVAAGTPPSLADIEANATAVHTVIQGVFSTNFLAVGTQVAAAEFPGLARAVEAVTLMARKDYTAAFRTDRLNPLATELAANTGGVVTDLVDNTKADVTRLVKLYQTAATPPYTYAPADMPPKQTIQDLTGGTDNSLGGQTLTLDDPDSANAGDGVALGFTEDPAAPGTGTVAFAVTSTDEQGNQTTQNLGGTYEQLDEYTILMTIEIAPGVSESVVTTPTLDENGNTVYNFDYNGEQQSWSPATGSGF